MVRARHQPPRLPGSRGIHQPRTHQACRCRVRLGWALPNDRGRCSTYGPGALGSPSRPPCARQKHQGGCSGGGGCLVQQAPRGAEAGGGAAGARGGEGAVARPSGLPCLSTRQVTRAGQTFAGQTDTVQPRQQGPVRTRTPADHGHRRHITAPPTRWRASRPQRPRRAPPMPPGQSSKSTERQSSAFPRLHGALSATPRAHQGLHGGAPDIIVPRVARLLPCGAHRGGGWSAGPARHLTGAIVCAGASRRPLRAHTAPKGPHAAPPRHPRAHPSPGGRAAPHAPAPPPRPSTKM